MWPRLCETILVSSQIEAATLVGIPSPCASANSIRNWLQENKALLKNVHAVDLSDLGIKHLPVEMHWFSHLTSLALNNNSLSVVNIDWPELRVLHLRNNRLRLVNTIYPLRLHVLDLRDNPSLTYGRGLYLFFWKVHPLSEWSEWIMDRTTLETLPKDHALRGKFRYTCF
jgi:Leucine-rich repeat (LRR) protein